MSDQENTHALDGPINLTFYRYLLPSIVGLLAMTSASLVDGIFIGNFIGVPALAAVNLIIPILSLLFGVGLMLSIGGSVRAGKFLGEKNPAAASAIFSKTLIAVLIYATVVIALGLIFERQLFRLLGADADLMRLMSEYYRVVMPFFFAQLGTIVLYFFIRLDGYPSLTAAALVVGSVINIALDYLFIAHFQWGISGAAWATGLSQMFPLLVLLGYFFTKQRKLRFSIKQSNWYEVIQAAYNGISEFINEISGGIIAFLFNLMLIHRAGVDGVAAMTVMNYLMMMGFMVFFAIGDTSQVMMSQNFGARNGKRMNAFFYVAAANVLAISAICISLLLFFNEPLILIFLSDQNSDLALGLANEFIHYVWPLFLFAGFNMLISGYLTSVHLAFQSGVVALSRSLLLPATLLVTLYFLIDDYRFIYALALGEALTFALALFYLMRHRPSKVLQQTAPKLSDGMV
ncbi:MATE family efflux transporter [Reinekea marina]|uniref:Multidrug export protein MepA n=1 Tax=Reinekea marina TaxID=1310421 RepID=A0ABV7WRM1_9GAMM|nr:MATE family efflux transporter [Reinekea marina]MDN3647628.1 MATE family efflux transporter [Reinekea marina]